MIYINASILDNKPSGLGVYTQNVIYNLVKVDLNIKVFCPIKLEGVSTIIINKYVKTSYKKIGGLVRFIWTQLVLPLKTKKDDIVYHPFQYLSIFCRSKQVITIHDLIPMYYPQVARHQYYYYKYIMPILLRKASRIICISNNTKKDIIKFYNINEDKIQVIYNGYDEKIFNVNNVDDKKLKKYNIDFKYILMIGPSYEHKNMGIVINAFKDIKDNIDCNLLIVGKDSNYKNKLINLISEQELINRVKFLDYIDIEDLPTIYGCAECLVYPSLYEGFGFPIVEAAACGTQVICSNASSLPEVGGKKAIYFSPEDKESIKTSIMKFFNKANICKNIEYEYRENFSWKKASISILRVVKSI